MASQVDYDCLVLGSSGFISSHLIPRLVAEKKRVLVLGRTPPHKVENVDWLSFDLLQPSSWRERPLRVHSCIYMAALKGRFEKGTPDWDKQGKVTSPNFEKLFQTLQLQVSRLITLGSSEEYGAKRGDELIFEADEAQPMTSYGYWKAQLCDQGRRWALNKNRSHIHLRPFIVFGQNQDPQMFLGSLISSLKLGKSFPMTAGEQWRSFISVEAVCDVLIRSISLDGNHIFNVSSPSYLQIRDVAMLAHQLIGRGRLEIGALPYREFEVWHQKPSLAGLLKIWPDLRFNDFPTDLKELIQHELKS